MGLALVQRLQEQAELWLVRELWHILDNSLHFARHPRSLTAPHEIVEPSKPKPPSRAETTADARAPMPEAAVSESLRAWESIRSATDLAGLRLFWLGDGLSESLLPEGVPGQVHAIHEHLVEVFDRALLPQSPVACGQRDALALAVALGGAPILGCLDASTSDATPCTWLRIPKARSLHVDDHWAAWEREKWLALLGRSGCLPLLWGGLNLAVVNVHVPGLVTFCSGMAKAAGDEDCPIVGEAYRCVCDEVRLFWHSL